MSDDRAMIALTDSSHIEAFWIIGWGLGDWLAVVYRDSAESPLQAKCRFRYYESAKVWESDDKKSRYVITPGPDTTADDLCRKMDDAAAFLAASLRAEFPGRTVKVISKRIRGSAAQFLQEFSKTGFAHQLLVPEARGPVGPQ